MNVFTMSTDLNDLGLLLDSKVTIPDIESSKGPGGLKMITEGLNRLGFSEEPESIDSPDATKVLHATKTAGRSGLHVLYDFHPYLNDGPVDIRWPRLNRAIHQTNPLSVVIEEKIRRLRHWTTDRCVFANE